MIEAHRSEQLTGKKLDRENSMHEIKRRIEFDAGHRVMNHEGKCKHLHGHRYVVELFVVADELDSLGRVIDFSVLKSVVGKWLDETFDHKTMLWHKDENLINFLTQAGHGNDLAIVGFNPTAENIAEHIYHQAGLLLRGNGIKVSKITVHETPNCSATYPI